MSTRSCFKCHAAKDASEFAWRNKEKGTYQPWCRSCRKTHDASSYQNTPGIKEGHLERNNQRRQVAMQLVWDYLTQHACVTCGEADPVVLEFDHRVPADKDLDISEMVRRAYSLQRITAEIEKCDVLCANCHRRKTALQFGWYRRIQPCQ